MSAHPSNTTTFLPIGDHEACMRHALAAAANSPPSPDKFCVGAALVDADTGAVLSTGYSLELPANHAGDPGTTHAEQVCLIKVAERHGLLLHLDEEESYEERLGREGILPPNTVLYTTMEPCGRRRSGNTTCTERILRLGRGGGGRRQCGIKTVYVGIREPSGVFVDVREDEGRNRLEAGGVRVEFPVEHMRAQIVEVSMAGHSRVAIEQCLEMVGDEKRDGGE